MRREELSKLRGCSSFSQEEHLSWFNSPGGIGTDQAFLGRELQGPAVETQLDAFAEDDAVGAFELATSDTQTKIGSPDNFLHLVKKHYNPIYRHQIVIFSSPEVIEGETIQLVRVTDRDSHVWLAIYRMQRETDGSWKIDGCQLLETTSISI